MNKKCYFEKRMDTPEIKATGRAKEINKSSILTKLIQEAGRWCRNYASELFISWQSVLDRIERGESGYELFGFREDGVDHEAFIEARYDNPATYGSARNEYRAIWKLDIEIDNVNQDVQMTLYEVNR